MSQDTIRRLATGAALALALAAVATAADPPAPAKDAAANKRTLYIVKHRAAKDLAGLLGKYFKGAAEFRTVPESPINALLISATPSAFDDAVQAAQQLDRPRRAVSLDVWVAEAAPKKADGDKPAPEQPDVKAQDLTGPTVEVAARMEELQSKGALADVKRIRLTAVEGRPESVLLGEARAFTLAVNNLAAGPVVRSLTYRDVGSQVQATVYVSPDNVVAVDLRFEDARPHTPEGGAPIGNDEKGKPIFATEFLMTQWNGKLTVPSGRTQVVEDTKTNSKADGVRLILVVGATVIEPDAKPEK